MLQHEMQADHGGLRKRYLPPKWGYERNPIPTVHAANPGKTAATPIPILSALTDRTVCIGSEQLPFPFPLTPEKQIPYLNVLNSFIRYLSSAFPPKKFCATH
jgi:hypothetical protein